MGVALPSHHHGKWRLCNIRGQENVRHLTAPPCLFSLASYLTPRALTQLSNAVLRAREGTEVRCLGDYSRSSRTLEVHIAYDGEPLSDAEYRLIFPSDAGLSSGEGARGGSDCVVLCCAVLCCFVVCGRRRKG